MTTTKELLLEKLYNAVLDYHAEQYEATPETPCVNSLMWSEACKLAGEEEQYYSSKSEKEILKAIESYS